VEVVARSIAALTVTETLDPGYIEYPIVNPHRDVDLDTVVDWVATAGYRIDRIDDYAEWHRAFANRLNSLSRSKREQSLLPLLHGWERPRASPQRDRDDDDSSRFDLFAHLSGFDATERERLSEIPRITEAFIHKCLSDMEALGLIDASHRNVSDNDA
jgi:fatty acid CoA ligase FadD9